MEPQDAWAASKLATMLGYGNPDDFQELGPDRTFQIWQKQREAGLREKEMAELSAWKQAQLRATLMANQENNATERWKTQEQGRQKLALQDESTTGLPFGREQLASREAIERWKTAQQNATLRGAMDQRMKIAEMNAGSRTGKQLGISDFMMIYPQIKKSLPPEMSFIEAYKRVNEELMSAQNPMRQQLMQRQQQPGPQSPMVSPHQQAAPQRTMGPQAMLEPDDYYGLGLDGLGWA